MVPIESSPKGEVGQNHNPHINRHPLYALQVHIDSTLFIIDSFLHFFACFVFYLLFVCFVFIFILNLYISYILSILNYILIIIYKHIIYVNLYTDIKSFLLVCVCIQLKKLFIPLDLECTTIYAPC